MQKIDEYEAQYRMQYCHPPHFANHFSILYLTILARIGPECIVREWVVKVTHFLSSGYSISECADTSNDEVTRVVHRLEWSDERQGIDDIYNSHTHSKEVSMRFHLRVFSSFFFLSLLSISTVPSLITDMAHSQLGNRLFQIRFLSCYPVSFRPSN